MNPTPIKLNSSLPFPKGERKRDSSQTQFLKQKARELRKNMTPTEKILWSRIRKKQILGVQFYRQKIITNYIVDFCAPSLDLIIEIDGSQHFDNKHAEKDLIRDKKLEEMGYKVLRYTNHQINHQLENVLDDIFYFVDKKKSVLSNPTHQSLSQRENARGILSKNNPPSFPPLPKEESQLENPQTHPTAPFPKGRTEEGFSSKIIHPQPFLYERKGATKKFTVINTPFMCEVCGHTNPPAPKTCRDHCRECLHSKHVDINPGDRAETCHGILEPIDFEYKSGVPDRIIFRCTKCGKNRVNKLADDDNRDRVWAVLEKRKI